ncbi:MULTISPECIES: hypothetical protein [unclassified Crossiella]|uniref:hypothetical protein n=1 Tax=unclassified Crossiella TaxID=2620835 RepID=UPI001FFF5FA8|nr:MULTISPECIES: hypothetical protein [unclassified Crossiella]MCK2237755.1 hypothetical protein [Crossiella sp. S99.2]MCK2255041.1 hypothetical protein [Crossiella sp. S99.1]
MTGEQPDDAAVTALIEWQREPDRAYGCPIGHGELRPIRNGSGLLLVCPECAHTLPVDPVLVTEVLGERPPGEVEPPRLPDGRTPRGLCPDGTVRTTGWLLLGRRPVPSALLSGLAGIAVLTPVLGWLGLAIGLVVGFGGWQLVTTWLQPASRFSAGPAVLASVLRPGQWARLYGSLGPVGQVSGTAATAAGDLVVRFRGGAQVVAAPTDELVTLELVD